MNDTALQLRMCADILDSYVVIARDNLAIARDQPLSKLRPSGPERLLAAHRVASAGAAEYGVLHACTLGGGMTPLSLQFEFSIHNNIIAIEAMGQSPAAQAHEAAFRRDVLDRLELICIDAVSLAEAFRHAAEVCADEALTPVLMGRMGIDLKAPPPNAAEQRLDEAIAAHKGRLTIRLRSLVPVLRGSATAPQRMNAVRANPYPMWMCYRDHPGSREINYVWHPKEYADQMMAYLARQQAQAMAQRA